RLRPVHRRLRHAGPERGQSIARRAVIISLSNDLAIFAATAHVASRSPEELSPRRYQSLEPVITRRRTQARTEPTIDCFSAGADQIRAGDQPQDCEGNRPRYSINGPCPRRRGDRVMKRREFITLLARYGEVVGCRRAAASSRRIRRPDSLGYWLPRLPRVTMPSFRLGIIPI